MKNNTHHVCTVERNCCTRTNPQLYTERCASKLQLRCHRLFHCACQEQPTRSFNPVAKLLPERTSPELLYLEAKFASLMSYGLSAKILQELLPIEGEISTATVRNNLHEERSTFGTRVGGRKRSLH